MARQRCALARACTHPLRLKPRALFYALNLEARPTTTKAATGGGFIKATANGDFVKMQEAGQGKSDEAEAACVKIEAEMARLKAMIAELVREIEDSHRDGIAWCVPPEGRRRIEEDMRRIEEHNARIRKTMQDAKMKLKCGIVAGEMAGLIRRMKRAEFRWQTCMEVLRVMQCTREDAARVAAVQGTVVGDSRGTRRDKVMHMAGDFESAITTITAVQHSRTAGLSWSVLAGTAQAAQGCSDTEDRANRILDYMRLTRECEALKMQYHSIQEWRYKTYEGVWDAQTQERERMKTTRLEEATRQRKQRLMKIDKKMKTNETMKIDEKMKNMKPILRKMTENKKSMKKKVDKDKEVLWKLKTTTSKSKSKSKNKGKSKR